MKRLKKWITLCMVVVMMFSIVGCNKKGDGESTKVSEPVQGETKTVKEPVTLEWWYRGNGVQKDTEKVEEKVNEYLKTYEGLEHVSINLNCYTGAEYLNAVILAQSAGKQIDILNTVSIDFAAEVEKGTFLPINDYLNQMPELKNELPDWLWDLGTIEGNTYIVPNYQRASNMMYLCTPKEYMDKYGDIDQIRSVLQNPESSVNDIAAVLETYGTAVQAGEGTTKYMPPLANLYNNTFGFTNFYDVIYKDFYKFYGKGEVENVYMTDEMLEAYEVSSDWYKKGLIHPDILTIDTIDFERGNMMNDVSFIYSLNNQAGDEERVSGLYTTMYGFDTYSIPINTNYYITNTWGAGGNGVTASSEHPEEALRFIEALTTEKGKDIYNLMVYGIEGVHYEQLDETHIKTLEYESTQGGVDASYAAMKWIIGNTFHAYLNQACLDDDNEIALEINTSDKNLKSDLMGFNTKIKNVEMQIEQTTAVTTEYIAALRSGVYGDDWKTYYDDYVSKMEAAGLNEIIAEFQTQVDGFLGK